MKVKYLMNYSDALKLKNNSIPLTIRKQKNSNYVNVFVDNKHDNKIESILNN